MPLSKERMRERKKLDRQNVKPMSNLNTEDVIPDVKPSVQPNVQPVQPNVKPKQHCRLPFCVICDPERYQEWFKQTYGYYDDHYI